MAQCHPILAFIHYNSHNSSDLNDHESIDNVTNFYKTLLAIHTSIGI